MKWWNSEDYFSKSFLVDRQELSLNDPFHGGFVLKFSGDAVIGYFVGKGSSLQAADDAVGCAESMLMVVQDGINKILSKEDAELPELEIKIGIDFGANTVVQHVMMKKTPWLIS